MKKLICLLFVLPLFAFGQDNSQDHIINITHIKVKMGHDAQFVEGVKMYKECYNKAGGENNWDFWRRVQGEAGVYAVTDMMANWAEMDDDSDEAGQKCVSIFPNFIAPHMKSIYSSITESIPEVSKDGNENNDKVWVTYFNVDNSADFMSVIKAVSGAVKDKEGDERAWWYSVAGGSSDAPDYMVVWPFDKYADLDEDMDGVWKIYEDANGEKKADEMRAKFRASVKSSSSYIYDRNPDMSN